VLPRSAVDIGLISRQKCSRANTLRKEAILISTIFEDATGKRLYEHAAQILDHLRTYGLLADAGSDWQRAVEARCKIRTTWGKVQGWIDMFNADRAETRG